jgi:UPF0755 protein
MVLLMSESADPKESTSVPTSSQQNKTRKRQVRGRKKKRRKRKPTKEQRSLYRTALTAAGVVLVAVAVLWISHSIPQTIDSKTIGTRDTLESAEPAMLLHQWLRNHRDEKVVFLDISAGATVSEVCKLVEEEGLLKESSSEDLRTYLVKNGLDTRIQAGNYVLDGEYGLEGISAILSQGYGEYAVLQIYPGLIAEDIDRRLYSLKIAEEGDFLHFAQLSAQERDLAFAEGYLLPGSYVIKTGVMAAQSLAEGMIDAMLDLTAIIKPDLARSGQNLEQIVIVASMIQRETASPFQMPLISSIIWNRIAAGMPLGIDATTRYETGNWQLPITGAQLRMATPYNTRIQKGLPPTGIGSPSPAALFAAFYPSNTEYYYYLHDRNGHIHPAVTYQEHQQNVNEFLN